MSGTEKNNKFSLTDLFFDQHLQTIMKMVGNFIHERILICMQVLRESMRQKLKIQVSFWMGQSCH